MITVSEAFKTAITSEEETDYAKLEFEFLDVDAYSDDSIAVTAENSFSKKDQMTNLVRDLSGKYATLETDYFLLDGSFVLPPKSTESGYEVGWWSSVLSQADSTFAADQVATITFTSDHSSIGITVTFDQSAEEYAEEFEIEAFDSGDVSIDSISVTGNTLSKYVWENNLTDYRKIVVTITKWCNPYRRARVTEIDFGIIKTYEDDKIVSLDIIEDIDTTSNTATTNEIQLMLDNSGQEFNILNPSGVYPYLQRRQKLKPFYGVGLPSGVEYVQMGVYYLNEWKSDQGGLTASFIARDMLDILTNSTYRKGKQQSRTLYNLAEDILTDGAVTDYTIDSALTSITSTGNIPIMSHREALQLIAMAGKAVVYSDRSGVVQIKQLSSTASGETIDFDMVYREPQIKLDKLVNTVDVVVNNYVAKGSSEEIHKSTINISGTVDVWCDYKEYPAQSCSSTVSGGVKNSETFYGNSAVINITAAGSVTITITGTVLEKSQSINRTLDGSAPSGEQPATLKIDNPLITSTSIASDVGTWILGEYNKRFLYEMDWRQNPSYEAGDIVTVEDTFSENKTMRITKQEWTYAGALSGKTSGRGAGT
jgi:hypothetical protein